LEHDRLIGIVTRTDVLRQLHRANWAEPDGETDEPADSETVAMAPRRLQLARLAPALREILTIAAQHAEAQGWHLYLVGGAVRDLLLADRTQSVMLNDIDLVVDGYYQAATAGAGVELARALQKRYPEARLEIHGRFQTAALLWHKDAILDSLWIDIATARTEFYPYPAANPEVEASSIQQDLYRRDFTINALAWRLTNPRAGLLLDFFGGYLDLQQQQIRVLHANSFIEDPTRIYRAVRFAVRLGFKIDEQTEAYIRHAIASGVYQQVQNGRAPALQTRLKAELTYLFQAPYWRSALAQLDDLQALSCIHPTLRLSDQVWWQLRWLDRALRRFDAAATLPHWQMLLEVLLASLESCDRVNVAKNLQLPFDSIDRLAALATTEQTILQCLQANPRPSQVLQCLQAHDLATLGLVAVRSPRSVRHLIGDYLTTWSQVKPILDGRDLQALGYKPGPQFKVILADLLARSVDGELRERDDAIAYLQAHYPRSAGTP
jgi:tRNA nucleotidyltransferase (CCA-adding enzyme)